MGQDQGFLRFRILGRDSGSDNNGWLVDERLPRGHTRDPPRPASTTCSPLVSSHPSLILFKPLLNIYHSS